jgi:hypothetical protein
MKVRRIATIVLVVLTSLMVLVSVVAVWATRTVFDTDRFTAVFEDVISDPAVTSALAERLTDEVGDAVQASGVIADNVPSELQPLLPVLGGAVRGFVSGEVDKFLQSDTGQQLMVGAVRRTHAAAIRVLEGNDTPGDLVSVETGAVTLNLVPAVGAVLGRVQERGLLTDVDLPDFNDTQTPQEQVELLSEAIGRDLRPTFGQFTVYESEKIDNAQSAVSVARDVAKQIKRFTLLLVIVALLMIALTIWVAPNRRRAMIQLGIGVAVAVVLAVIVERRVIKSIPNAITQLQAREASESILSAFSNSLNNANGSLLVLALLVALIGFMARPGGGDLRGHPEVARVAVGVIALGALWFVGLHWWSVIVVGAFVVVGLMAVAGAGGDEADDKSLEPPAPPPAKPPTPASPSPASS